MVSGNSEREREHLPLVDEHISKYNRILTAHKRRNVKWSYRISLDPVKVTTHVALPASCALVDLQASHEREQGVKGIKFGIAVGIRV